MHPALPFTAFIPGHLRSISTMGVYGTVPMSATLPSSGNWQTANYICYAPIYLPIIANLKQLWWANGVVSNVSTGVWSIVFQLPHATTAPLLGDTPFEIKITLASGHVITPIAGTMTVMQRAS